jgi:hypothetical protein
MRWFLRFYPMTYATLIVGAYVTPWRAGLLARLSGPWVNGTLVVAIAAGIVLPLLSSPRRDHSLD